MNGWEALAGYFAYPFVRYALIVGVLVSLCAGLLGVPLVLRRYSMMGDGLSHVAFGAMAVAAVLNVAAEMAVVLPVTVAAAVLLLAVNKGRRMKGDAALAMISVSALAIGYLLMNVFSTSANITGDVCTTLFGATSILTLSRSDVWLSAALSVVVLAVFILYFNRVFALSFDEEFARATGSATGAYNLIFSVITAVVIVIAMRLAGALLISALIIFPALSAMRLFKSFKSVVLCAGIIAVVCAGLGMLVSLPLGTPVGATIVVADLIVFGLSCAAGSLRGRSAVR